MAKPSEITEESIKNRLRMALTTVMAPGDMVDPRDFDKRVEDAYAAGNFHEYVDVVERATRAERVRAKQVCMRLGHGRIGEIILAGEVH